MLKLQNITKKFGSQLVVKDVNLEIEKGKIIGLVGESGCGKTTLARIIIGLERASAGNIFFEDFNLLSKKERSKSLKQKIQMIFQNATGSFNPKYTIVDSLKQACLEHNLPFDFEALFSQVGLPIEFKDRYPHQLSGGQMQRAAIARAIACKPSLLIADEPTSALDVSIRRHILNLLKKLQQEQNLACLIITHDLPSLRNLVDQVYVMHNGQIIESGSTEQVLNQPQKTYTKRLIAAIPSLNPLDKTFEKFRTLY